MRLSRLPLALLLAFLLVFAQQAAATHGLSHAADSQQDKHYPGGKACEKCAALAELSGAVPSVGVVFHVTAFTPHLARAVLHGVAHGAFSPYLSRAPPPRS